jgi:hypothetical protein
MARTSRWPEGRERGAYLIVQTACDSNGLCEQRQQTLHEMEFKGARPERDRTINESVAAEMFPVDEVLVTWGMLDFCGRLP